MSETSEKEVADYKLQQQLNELRQFIEAHDDIQVLLENSASWADSQAESKEKSRVIAWRVAIGAGAFGLLSLVVALTAIGTAFRPAPPPEILRVDKTTGATERLISLKEFQQTPEDATIRRNVATFMRARENYTYDTAEDNYYDAAAFMTPQLQQQWGTYWDTANPKSPLNFYKKDTKVHVDLGAITINRNADGLATSIRAGFTRTIKRNDLPVGPSTSWIATIPFHWVNAPTKERDRRVNDLGFEVTDYQVDADIGAGAGTLPQPPAPQQPAPTPTPSSMPALSAPQVPAQPTSRGGTQ